MDVKQWALSAFLGILISVEAAFSSSLTLTECLTRARQNSHLLTAAEKRIEAAQHNFQFDRSQTMPQISAELSAEQRYLAPYRFNQSWALLHGDWAVGNFFLNTEEAVRNRILMTQEQKKQTGLQVSQRTAQLYLSILKRQIRLELLHNRSELLQAHHDVARALWRAGIRTQLDVLQTEGEMLNLQEEINRVEMNRQSLLTELVKLLNWRDKNLPQLEAMPLQSICDRPLPEFDSEQVRSVPAIQAAEFEIQSQNQLAKSITASQWPRLHLAGGYFADGDPTGDGNYWQANAGIALPLFQWGATSFQRQESQADVLSRQSQKQDMERELTIQVNQTLLKLEKLKGLLALQEKRLQTSEQAFQFARANYEAGLIANLDFLSAQQQFSETQMAIKETQLEYVMNLVEFYIMTNQVDRVEHLY